MGLLVLLPGGCRDQALPSEWSPWSSPDKEAASDARAKTSARAGRKREAKQATRRKAKQAAKSKARDAAASKITQAAGDDPGDAAGLRVATWNVRRLGHGKKSLERVAEIIDDFDVVALQEVMSPEGVAELLAHLPGWQAELSARPVGRGSYEEWYAVLYRAPIVNVERAFVVDDEGDAFAREPFVVCMRARSFDFCVVAIHVIYGNQARARDQEIDALGHVMRGLRAREREQDWIVAGDFNRMPGAPGWDDLIQAGFGFTAEGELRTSLGKDGYRNAYDHILVDRRATAELDGPAMRIDIVARACAGDFDACSRDLSDHAPVMVRFHTSGPDDD